MQLFQGRPEDIEGRSATEVRVYDYLDDLGIEYYRLDHAPAFGSETELCREIEESLGAKICKNLFLANRQRTKFYMLMMPEDKVFRSSDVSKQAGSSRLHFAEPEYMQEMIGCTPGSASVMGLMNDTEHRVQLLVDEDVLNSEYVGCHPCLNTSSLRIRSEDIFSKFLNATGHNNWITVHID
jgi:Ala-tRNA(Pro) deacylase